VRQTKKVAGTVSALRPAQALTVKENILIIEAAQLMAAKRSDCVLVVDEEDHLSGIFTVCIPYLCFELRMIIQLTHCLFYRLKTWHTELWPIHSTLGKQLILRSEVSESQLYT
jgi:hypothetical protein